MSCLHLISTELDWIFGSCVGYVFTWYFCCKILCCCCKWVWRYGVHVVEASGMPRGGVQRLSASVHDALIQTTLNIATLLLLEPASWRISETGTPQSLSKSLSLWFWINTTTTAVYSVWGIPRFHYALVCTLFHWVHWCYSTIAAYDTEMQHSLYSLFWTWGQK